MVDSLNNRLMWSGSNLDQRDAGVFQFHSATENEYVREEFVVFVFDDSGLQEKDILVCHYISLKSFPNLRE